MRVVGHQPNALAAFTPGEVPGTHLLEAESTPGHMVLLLSTEKTPSDTTVNRFGDRLTSSTVPKPLHYPRPQINVCTDI
jgi:hypothetical protein